MKKICIILAAFIVAGCSFAPLKQPTLYSISPPIKSFQQIKKPSTVYISLAGCPAPFDSYFIYYKNSPFSFKAFKDARWIDVPCNMLKNTFYKALAKNGFKPALPSEAFCRISFNVYDFEPVFIKKSYTAKIDVDFLINCGRNSYKFEFLKSLKLKDNSTYSSVKALNKLTMLAAKSLVGKIKRGKSPR